MTAEIGMLNKYGVALAADSAVTTSTSNGYRKVYNSANKVFMLSEKAPVGIMIYGNAVFMDIPWETIIKLFRKNLAHNSFPTLIDYAAEFLRYISNDLMIDENAVENYLFNKLNEFKFELDDTIKVNSFSNMGDAIQDLEQMFNEYFNVIDIFQGIENLLDAALESKISSVIDGMTFESNVILDQALKQEVLRLFKLYLTLDYFTNESGVVIAGFGDNEYFPNLISYKIEGIISEYLKCEVVENVSIGPSNSAAIIPFAQTSMVHTFIKGINPGLMKHIKSQFNTTVHDLINEIGGILLDGVEETQKQELVKALHEAGNTALSNQFENLDAYQKNNHIMPIIDTVKMLNKDELAEMAESLVSITSIEKKMSMEIETVGGPIDVAIISKGDGFVWYKRKHYFDPNLNPHYFRNKEQHVSR